ncbi:MAG: hypothetical protein Q8P74_00780 [bacterium]|nr:hypothetical protein [bacterium]
MNRAFLLIKRGNIGWPNGGPAERPEIKGIPCVVLEKSAQKVAELIGGECDFIPFDGVPRQVIRLPRELFSPYPLSKKVFQYEKGPVSLCIGEKDAGDYLFIIEAPILELSQIAV